MFAGFDWPLILESGGPWAVVFLLFVFLFLALQRELFFTKGQHFRELASKDKEITARDLQIKDNNVAHQKAIDLLQVASADAVQTARAASEIAVNRLEVAHSKNIEALEHRVDRETQGVRSDLKEWRDAYYTATKVNQAYAERQDEILEAIKLILVNSERYDDILGEVKKAIEAVTQG